MNFIAYSCYVCGNVQNADFEGFICPSCGGNLEVLYNYDQIKKDLNFGNPFAGKRQDIFKYHPLLPVQNTSLKPPLRIGATPLYHAKRLGKKIGLSHVFLKDEGLNPSASFKDRASAVALVCARERNAKVVSAASTGNAGSSLACMAASLGQECVIFIPEKVPPAKLAQLKIFGARIISVKGNYDEAFDLCIKTSQEKGWFNRSTGINPFTREGKKTGAFEICEQLKWNAPDRIIIPVGDGNIISGIWKGLRELVKLGLINHLPAVDAVQAKGSAAIVDAFKKADGTKIEIKEVKALTLADSISVNLPRDGVAAVRAILESGGNALTVTDEEILNALKELAQSSGIFVEPAAAASWAGLKKMVTQGKINSDEKVVCLLTGAGLKDIESALRAISP